MQINYERTKPQLSVSLSLWRQQETSSEAPLHSTSLLRRQYLGPSGGLPEGDVADWQSGGACEFELRACADAPRRRGFGSGGLAGQVGVCGCGRRLGAVSAGGCNSAPALLMAARWPLRSDVVVEGQQGSVCTARRAARPGFLGRVSSSLSPGPCGPGPWDALPSRWPLLPPWVRLLNLSALSFHTRDTAVKSG